MIKLMAILTISLSVISCSTKQVAEFAYGSVKNQECLDKTGDISCNLDEESHSGVALIEPPNNNSNEALEERASKIRESQNN